MAYISIFPNIRRIVNVRQQSLTKVVYSENTLPLFTPIRVVTIAVNANVLEPCS